MMFFLLFIVLSDIQLTWTTVKTGNTCEWSCYLLLCCIHPGILLHTSSPEDVLGLLSSCGDALAIWLWSTQNRERAQRLYWAQQDVPIGSELRGFQAWSRALPFTVRESLTGDGPPWRENTPGRKVLVASSEPWESWVESGHIPRIFSTRTITSFLFIQFGLGLLATNDIMSDKGKCPFPMHLGDEDSHGTCIRGGKPSQCQGSDYHRVYIFWGAWEIVSEPV